MACVTSNALLSRALSELLGLGAPLVLVKQGRVSVSSGAQPSCTLKSPGELYQVLRPESYLRDDAVIGLGCSFLVQIFQKLPGDSSIYARPKTTASNAFSPYSEVLVGGSLVFGTDRPEMAGCGPSVQCRDTPLPQCS